MNFISARTAAAERRGARRRARGRQCQVLQPCLARSPSRRPRCRRRFHRGAASCAQTGRHLCVNKGSMHSGTPALRRAHARHRRALLHTHAPPRPPPSRCVRTAALRQAAASALQCAPNGASSRALYFRQTTQPLQPRHTRQRSPVPACQPYAAARAPLRSWPWLSGLPLMCML